MRWSWRSFPALTILWLIPWCCEGLGELCPHSISLDESGCPTSCCVCHEPELWNELTGVICVLCRGWDVFGSRKTLHSTAACSRTAPEFSISSPSCLQERVMIAKQWRITASESGLWCIPFFICRTEPLGECQGVDSVSKLLKTLQVLFCKTLTDAVVLCFWWMAGKN